MSTSVMEVILLNQESFQKENASGTSQEHLATDCGKGAQDPTAHLGKHSEAGPEQTGVAILSCYPMPDGIHGRWVSEWVSAVSEQSMKSENSIFTIKKSRSGLISVVSYV